MYKIIINFTFLFIINLPLAAMDLNETTSIINEAADATHILQNKFDTLINEEPNYDVNTSSVDSNESMENNESAPSEIEGKSIRGLIIFKTRIRPVCEINGEAFAKQYMQEDWEDIYADKEFKMEILKACPKIEKRYKDSWTPHLYQFSIEYASDSDAIPDC